MKRKKMTKVNDAGQPAGSKDENTGLTPSVVKLQRLIGPSLAYRMLTPDEIELLRESKREIDQIVGEVLAKKNNKE